MQNPHMIKVGDIVKRKHRLCDIPDTEPGAAGMSINTSYEVIWVSPDGKCVLKDYLMLVSPEYLEIIPSKKIG